MEIGKGAPSPVRSPALVIVVAALGYFVDIFDLLLFAIVRVDSLKSLGVAQDQLKPVGLWLDNFLQVTGLVFGGIAWGILGDRRGRLSVLFGSILTYSLANILNAFIADVPNAGAGAALHAVGLGTAVNQYGVLRFIAGFGLAGELGAGITLAVELVSLRRRGVATTLIATIGVLGAVAAFGVTRLVDWRMAYLIGGGMGLALLTLRIGVVESGMFEAVRTKRQVGRGSFWLLLYPMARLRRYLCTILTAVPIWYCIGILVKYCDAIGRSLGMPENALPSPGAAIMWAYTGLALGDLASGLLSQMIRSRRGALWIFHILTALSVVLYFTVAAESLVAFYACACLLGFAAGYWAVFVTTSAELFGTNLRATAATSAPNFVRWSAAGSALLWTTGERLLGGGPSAPWQSAAIVGAILIPLAMIAVLLLPETFDRDLDFEES
jgi:MFS family permease